MVRGATMTDKLTCKEVSKLISQGQEGELPPSERARLRLHFVICETCRGVNEQFAFLREAMKRLGQNGQPPER